MSNLYYFLISVISYLGIIAGFILMTIAPEEKKPGIKYFKKLNYLFFVLFLVLQILLSNFSIYLIGLAIIGLFLFIYLKQFQIYVAYLLFSFVFYAFSSKYLEVFSVIIFAFGLSAGAYVIDLKQKKKSFLHILLLFYFVIISNLLKLSLL